MFSKAFALKRPWGLLTEDQRIQLDQACEQSLQTGCGLWVVAPENLRVRYSGRRQLPAEAEGGCFVWPDKKQLWSIPFGAKPSETRFVLTFESEAGGQAENQTIELKGALFRPEDPNDETEAGQLARLVLALVERIRTLLDISSFENDYRVTGRKLISVIVPWKTAVGAWSQPVNVNAEPPLDIIVRHAQTLHTTVENLGGHPRRILRRIRERLPINRVQEMDPACLEWYSRQPGRDFIEKAGSRQTLLGVTRHKNFDTHENRVFLEYLKLASGAAASYQALHKGMTKSEQLGLVARFGRLSKSLERDLRELGVSNLPPPAAPNYVLQHDRRYRKIWDGYLALLRRKQEEDDIWRWQTRLWSEFVRLSVLIALRMVPGAEVLAETQLQIRNDQERGRWVDLSAFPAVIALPIDDQKCAITIIDAQDPRARHFKDDGIWNHLWSVGPSCVLHSQIIDTGVESWILLWAIHPMDGTPPDLAAEVKSADNSLNELRRQIARQGGGQRQIRGVVLTSDARANACFEQIDFGETLACRCPADPNSLSSTLKYLSDMLPIVVGG